MSPKINSTRDDFEDWLMDMDDALEDFFKDIGPELSAKLDFSPKSLDVIEQILLNRYPSIQATVPRNQAQFLDGAARYIGESFRKQLGGKWDIELENPNDVHFGLPVITDFRNGSGPRSPLMMATMSTHRRYGDYLRRNLQDMIREGRKNK